MAKSATNYAITKRKDGRWHTELMSDGKRVHVYGKTQAEVKAKLKRKLEEFEQARASGLNNYASASSVTVKEWATKWLETYAKMSVRPSTYGGYKTIVEHHLDGIGHYKLSEISPVVIQDFLQKNARMDANAGKEGYLGEKSLLNLRNYLHVIFQQAVTNGMMIRNPADGVKIPKAGTRITRALTIEEQKALLTVARNAPRKVLFAVVFALYTGCRKGEVLGLQWSDVDFENNVIHITKQLTRHIDMHNKTDNNTILELSEPKTRNSVRDVYMFKSFAAEFLEYKQNMIEWKAENGYVHSEEDFVFCSTVNKAMEPRVFYKYYTTALKNAGIEDADFHTLRHTFATRGIEAGMDILMLSRTLGHSNISTTLNKYSHLLPSHQKACMEKLESLFF